MFVRVKKRTHTEQKAVQIVASKRVGKKVMQKVIQTVGYAYDDDIIERLKDVAEHIKVKLMEEVQPSLFDSKELAERAIKARKKRETERELNANLKKLKEKQRTIIGIHEIYGKIYEELNFNRILTPKKQSAAHILYHTVMGRLASPKSKRATVSMLQEDFGITLSLDKVYRMMDKIDEKVVDKIQKNAYESTKSIIRQKINVLFYDCTTLYFESFKPDELKQNGYSKDGKFNQPQVVLALLVTQSGLPIGYEVFPGATFEGDTLEPILQRIKIKYDLNQVIFVADSGLLSKKNRAFLEKNNFDYILGARLKSLPKTLQKTALESINKEIKKEEVSGEVAYQGKRIIVKYSSKRARKDKRDRKEAIKRIEKNFSKSKNVKTFLSNYGYKKFIDITGESTLQINEEKIKEEEKWDGISGVVTNIENMSQSDILGHYKNLWQIESCFRIQKTDLKIRPIYHWTPKRVQAHIAICFMAFTCQQYLVYRLKLQSVNLSIEKIRKALTHMQLSILEHKDKKATYYGIPSNISEEAKEIYKIMRTKYSAIPFLIE